MTSEATNVDKITHGKGLENKEEWKKGNTERHKKLGGRMEEEKLMRENKKQ